MKKIFLVLGFVFMYSFAYAASLGHYSPHGNGVRDDVMPLKNGFSFSVYNTYYTADNLRGPGGAKFDSLTTTGTVTEYIKIQGKATPVTLTGNASANFEFEMDTFSQTFDITWRPPVKFLGADYAFLVSPSWGYALTVAKATANANCSVSVGSTTKAIAAGATGKFKEENTGFGDLYVQPVWLAWRGEHFDLGFSYGFYAPTGYYQKDGMANIGLGFWTQQVQANAYYYPFASQATALLIRPTYEWNSRKVDEDVTPGQTITFEYGVSQYVHPSFEIALLGYNQLQLTGEGGDQPSSKGPLSYTAGLGATAKYWIIKDKCSVWAKFDREYGTKFNFQGDTWSLNATWIF